METKLTLAVAVLPLYFALRSLERTLLTYLRKSTKQRPCRCFRTFPKVKKYTYKEMEIAGFIIGAIAQGLSLYATLSQKAQDSKQRMQDIQKNIETRYNSNQEEEIPIDRVHFDSSLNTVELQEQEVVARVRERFRQLLREKDNDLIWGKFVEYGDDINEELLYWGRVPEAVENVVNYEEYVALTELARHNIVKAVEEYLPILPGLGTRQPLGGGKGTLNKRIVVAIEFVLTRSTDERGAINPNLVRQTVKLMKEAVYVGKLKDTLVLNPPEDYANVMTTVRFFTEFISESDAAEIGVLVSLIVFKVWLKLALLKIESKRMEEIQRIATSGKNNPQEVKSLQDLLSKLIINGEQPGNIAAQVEPYGPTPKFTGVEAEVLYVPEELERMQVTVMNNFAVLSEIDWNIVSGYTSIEDFDKGISNSTNYVRVYLERCHRARFPNSRRIDFLEITDAMANICNTNGSAVLQQLARRIDGNRTKFAISQAVKTLERIYASNPIKVQLLPNVRAVMPYLYMVDASVDEKFAIQAMESLMIYGSIDGAVVPALMRGTGKLNYYYKAARNLSRLTSESGEVHYMRDIEKERDEIVENIRKVGSTLFSSVSSLADATSIARSMNHDIADYDRMMKDKLNQEAKQMVPTVYVRKGIIHKVDEEIRSLVILAKRNELLEAMEERKITVMSDKLKFMESIGVKVRPDNINSTVKEDCEAVLYRQYKGLSDAAPKGDELKLVVARLADFSDVREALPTATKLRAAIGEVNFPGGAQSLVLVQQTGPLRSVMRLTLKENGNLQAAEAEGPIPTENMTSQKKYWDSIIG